jgi:hypothetical protein
MDFCLNRNGAHGIAAIRSAWGSASMDFTKRPDALQESVP